MRDPDQLGKYTIRRILGEGGMGIVYMGIDPDLNRPVAIKTIRRGLLQGRAGLELRERFRREAQAEGRMLHPNIVAIYDFGEDDEGTPYFVMEYVEGRSLKEFLTRGMHFNLQMTLHITSQLLSALDYSHCHGVVHRDVKPANILLTEEDTVKIADFGIARMEESEFTATGRVMGTPQYLSPEQRAGQKTDARSDLYSTGLVLYELLTGEKPFAGQSHPGKNHRLTPEHLAKLDNLPPDVLPQFKAVLTRALEREPADRYQSASAFLADLEPLIARPETSPRRRRKRLWLPAVAVLVGIGAGLLWWQRPLVVGWLPADGNTANTDPRDKVLSPAQQERAGRLLKIADIHLRVGRLILPEGSNAYAAYQMVLEVDPGNAEARRGLAEIQDRLLRKLQQMIEQGELEAARSQLSLARRLFPDNEALAQLEIAPG
nr:serine/threonine-protein kinase [Parahaliea mediterranea]